MFTICVAALTFRRAGKGFAIATGWGILNKQKCVRNNSSSSRSQVERCEKYIIVNSNVFETHTHLDGRLTSRGLTGDNASSL